MCETKLTCLFNDSVRTRVEHKSLDAFKNYNTHYIKSKDMNIIVANKLLQYVLYKNDLTSIVIWENNVIKGKNIVNLVQQIDRFRLKPNEVRAVKQCEVMAIFVENATYEDIEIYKYL